MIKLTKTDGEPIYINSDKIVSVDTGEYGVRIGYGQGDYNYIVTESPEEVVRKVLEWKLLMKRYQAYTESAACDHNPISNDCWELSTNVARKLFELAGLKEEPEHDAG